MIGISGMDASEPTVTLPPIKGSSWRRRILVAAHILLDVGLFAYSGYGIFDYLFLTGPVERANLIQLPIDLVNYAGRKNVTRPRSIEVSAVTIVPSEHTADIVATVKNPNDTWYGLFEYRFVLEGVQTSEHSSFILPGETKLLRDLRVPVEGEPKLVRVEITNTRWQRVNAHIIPDYASWRAERMAFSVSEPFYTAQGTIEFAIQNKSPFSYRSVSVPVVFSSAGKLLAVDEITFSDFRTGEQRTLAVPAPKTDFEEVVVKPEVNPFDEQVYLE